MKGRQRSMAIRSGINKQGWQKSDFPVACEKCYGQNPLVRMLKQDYGQECRICFRPFTVFKWKGDRGVYKRTSVCQSCSKEKNICQVCTLDLEFGLPMQVRDKRCGKNGKFLLDQNFTNVDSIKMKPPPPPGPPPMKPASLEKQLVYIPQKDSDDEDNNQNELGDQQKGQANVEVKEVKEDVKVNQKIENQQQKQEEIEKIESQS